MNRIVETTLSLVAHKLAISNVTVQQDLAAKLPLVYCDASQIQQVVLNLLLNAAEAVQSRPQAGIRVSTRLAAPGAVTLSVRDSGEGIPAGNLSRIFDPFFTTKGEGKGVGLGLAVSYGIVEAHGGEIEVNSKVGEGTEFVVKLPVMAAHAMEQAG